MQKQIHDKIYSEIAVNFLVKKEQRYLDHLGL